MREFSIVGGYTDNPEKPQNCQNWGWALVWVWALIRDNPVVVWVITVVRQCVFRPPYITLFIFCYHPFHAYVHYSQFVILNLEVHFYSSP